MANIPHHHARIAGVPRSGPPAGAPDIDARRASSRPRSRLSVCLSGGQTSSQTPAAGPESPRSLVFLFFLGRFAELQHRAQGGRSRRPWIRVFQKTDMPVARMTRCGFGRSGRWELQGVDLFHESPGLASGSMRRGGPACVCRAGWWCASGPSLDKIHLQSRDAPARLSPLFGPLKLSVAGPAPIYRTDGTEPTGPT